ncbi:deoxyribodipyrimidine photo-lyase [Shewanella aquimarina]|uniref:deoxyribodipyrimidine photo-lyase n=1 Tax=Shewanella aquimarina TaxID=260365 RepID=UPI0020148D9C|nr:deoxyribodipyrimidine photo-lyase [Shewanella aquimarina]MCL2910102.1 deoxyribodipyrimidine photo-lyase [Shewanella aquimarina]
MSALLWLRRDFRLHDNPALSEAVRLGVKQAVFIATPAQWHNHDMAPIKADLIRRHLKLMHKRLSEYGIELLVLSAADFSEQVKVLCDFCRANAITLLLANGEPELDERQRDADVMATGLELRLWQNDCILPPGGVLNQQGEMFKVFTPFKKAWLKCVAARGIECVPTPTLEKPLTSDEVLVGGADAFTLDYPLEDSSIWPDSEQVMTKLLPAFWQEKLLDYSELRDFPAIKGTSGLSPYLAIGAISPRWLALQLVQRHPEVIYDSQHAAFSWLNELIWRDFYKHLLFHYPDLIKGRSFQPKYESLPWPNNEAHFQAWCEGRTGYPIVDAAMKQLRRTGWMHNRLRMIVASFLTKHLLVDWHKGERFFMQQLIDGDFSANNGGWQWAASTGCDAQPYFRIFNPITQSQKFDPRGDFIRKYLPELSEVPDKQIHFPHDYLVSQGKGEIYPAPIVDHKAARARALAFYKVE